MSRSVPFAAPGNVRAANRFRRAVPLLAAALSLAPRASAAEGPDAAGERPALITVVPRLGTVAYGRGKLAVECEGPCTGFAGSNTGYSHEPAFTFGADALFGVWRYLRLGPSFAYTVTNDVDLPPAGTYQVGDDWTLDAAAEGFIPVAPRWGVAPRVQAGLIDLDPHGALRAHLDSVRGEDCAGEASCPIPSGARLGWNVAFGAGGFFRVHPRLRVRLDALLEYYSISLYTLQASLFRNSIEVHESLSGARLIFTLGLEVF